MSNTFTTTSMAERSQYELIMVHLDGFSASRNPEGQMARWLEVLGTYDLEIQHHTGERHGNADALSHRPCGTCPYCMRQEKKEETCVVPGTVEGQVRHLTHDPVCIVESYTKEQVHDW